MTNPDISYVRAAVAKNKHKPGMPITKFPLSTRSAVEELVASGELKIVSTTKPSLADPSKAVTYRYVTTA